MNYAVKAVVAASLGLIMTQTVHAEDSVLNLPVVG